MWGGLNQPAPSRSPQNTVKNQFFFDFLKVYIELGKVKKVRPLDPLFHGEIAFGKRAGTLCEPRTNRVNSNSKPLHTLHLLLKFSWQRTCSELEDEIEEYADTSKAPGYLGIDSGISGASTYYRVPGPDMKSRFFLTINQP